MKLPYQIAAISLSACASVADLPKNVSDYTVSMKQAVYKVEDVPFKPVAIGGYVTFPAVKKPVWRLVHTSEFVQRCDSSRENCRRLPNRVFYDKVFRIMVPARTISLAEEAPNYMEHAPKFIEEYQVVQEPKLLLFSPARKLYREYDPEKLVQELNAQRLQLQICLDENLPDGQTCIGPIGSH